MADNLPLLPDKDAACGDVRGVLREVFRDLATCCPPSAGVPPQGDCEIGASSGERAELHRRECELREERARRLARATLPNIYRLRSPGPTESPGLHASSDLLLLKRKDLKPSVDQDAGGDRSLWVQNILNRSSGDLGALRVAGSRLHLPASLEAAGEGSAQSASVGELQPKPSPPPAPPPPAAPEPAYVVAIPPSLEFVNFTVGQLHTQSIRLVNVSKAEVRLAVRAPARRELAVALRSRLALTAGAAAELRVQLRARDVRALADELHVRVSAGRALRVRVACYHQPPLLHLIMPTAHTPRPAAEGGAGRGATLELGARLLGDVHRVPFELRCGAPHAAFFLMSDDSWTYCLLQVTASGTASRGSFGISTDCFYVRPARWRGGGRTRALAACRAAAPGLLAAELRVAASTAIVRSLSLVADSLLFSPDHVTLQAHDKDYDIMSADDPACGYYVNLGVAFPHRELAATVDIINSSPLVYKYRWGARAWGACTCWQDFQLLPADERADDALCAGALHAKTLTAQGERGVSAEREGAAGALRVSGAAGWLAPRSRVPAQVHAPDVGGSLRERRAVLMLILQNVPEESFPPGYDPMIVKTDVIEEKCIPGVCAKWSRKVCDVVCAQLEVWWKVVPVRFQLDPPLLLLPHSRRVKSVEVSLRSTQLCGAARVPVRWAAACGAPPPALAPLQAAHSAVRVPLPELPDRFPHSQLIQLVAESEEWSSSCRVERWCSTRHPALSPASLWLGVRPPGAPVAAELAVLNDTHQHICWWGSVHRWVRERGPAGACEGRAPCAACCSRACACGALSPARGALPHGQAVELRYCVNAPDTDGCVATLVRVRRTAADVARVPSERGSDARAALLAYRVLAPRLVLRVMPCHGNKARECEGCRLEPGCSALGGAPVLRPRGALPFGRRACCRLQLTNITPLPTSVAWTPAIEGEDVLAVTFIPNEFKVGGYATVEILVVLEARRVSTRRVWVRAARVAHAYAPLFLVIDAAISGVEVVVEFPIGGEERTTSFVKIPMTQSEPSHNEWNELLTPDEAFARDDCKRALQKENICHCPYELVYIPPPPPPPAPPGPFAEECGEYSPVSILEEPPPLARVCACCGAARPALPDHDEPYCLQFRRVPLRAVRSRTLVLRNVSRLEARWRAAVRRWPRRRARTIDREQWARDVREAGVALECAPAAGALAARGRAELAVRVYADCWGLYRDQILIQVEGLEPLVVDVWVEATGAPLQFPPHAAPLAAPLAAPQAAPQAAPLAAPHPPTLWMSYSDPERMVRLSNASRARLTTHVYLLKAHEFPQDELPFRLYYRFYDVPPRTCPCVTAFESNIPRSEGASSAGSALEDVDTALEIFLAPDHGVQADDAFYHVEPRELSIEAGACAALAVRLRRQQPATPHVLLLHSAPSPRAGPGWWRPPPPPQTLRLLQAQRAPRLQALRSELRVALCALDLPAADVLRVRKKFRIQNTGEGPLEAVAATEAPWRIELSRDVCDAHCVRPDRHDEFENLELKLAPRSSVELFAEVSVRTEQSWPPPGAAYPPRAVSATALNFYDRENILLLSLPLILELELPVLRTEPEMLDFGFVGDGSTRKSYFTVSHSSRSTLELVTQWSGEPQFRLSPPALTLRGGASARVYVQYTARWVSERFSEGAACVAARGAAGAWCRAALRVRARATRPRALHAAPAADHTDDPHLLPPAAAADS